MLGIEEQTECAVEKEKKVTEEIIRKDGNIDSTYFRLVSQ